MQTSLLWNKELQAPRPRTWTRRLNVVSG